MVIDKNDSRERLFPIRSVAFSCMHTHMPPSLHLCGPCWKPFGRITPSCGSIWLFKLMDEMCTVSMENYLYKFQMKKIVLGMYLCGTIHSLGYILSRAFSISSWADCCEILLKKNLRAIDNNKKIIFFSNKTISSTRSKDLFCHWNPSMLTTPQISLDYPSF